MGNKNHKPTRAGTKRENWARHGAEKSKVDVSEIVPTIEEYRKECEAEYKWFDTLHDLEDRKQFDENRNAARRMAMKEKYSAGMAKQKVYDKRFVENMNKSSLAKRRAAEAEGARYSLFDALGYEPQDDQQSRKIQLIKSKVQKMASQSKKK